MKEGLEIYRSKRSFIS